MSESPASNPLQYNDLQFLTDSAFSSLFDDPGSSNVSKGKRGADGLFMERLESFIEGQLRDIESFSKREQVPLDEVRKLVALPHMKYMLSLDLSFPLGSDTLATNEKKSGIDLYTIKSILARLSNVLQLMYTTTGLDSLLLVVSPHAIPESTSVRTERRQSDVPVSEASWIGGTEVGKEFWMSLKGGGINGARAFRLKSQMRYQEESRGADKDNLKSFDNKPKDAHPALETPPAINLKSGDIKTELNAAVRQALRTASGNPSAEMRWTKPASLEELYGVRLVGWPASMNTRNPSNNSVKENRLLLDLLRSNQMKFVTKGSPEWRTGGTASSTPPAVQAAPTSISKRRMPTGTDIAETMSNSSELASGSSSNHSLKSPPVNTEESHQTTSSPTRPKKRMRST